MYGEEDLRNCLIIVFPNSDSLNKKTSLTFLMCVFIIEVFV